MLVHNFFHSIKRKPKSAPLEANPSTGPDPTLFRNNEIPGLEDGYTPPKSAPPVTKTDTAETWSRMDYGPGHSNFAPNPIRPKSRTRVMIRNLSTTGRGRTHQVEEDLLPPPIITESKAHRALGVVEAHPLNNDSSPVVTSQTERGQGQSIPANRTIRAAAFAPRAKRMSLLQHSPSITRHHHPTAKYIPAPSTPPSSHAKLDAHSNSPRGSVKSTKRAEREWRARLVALSQDDGPAWMGTPPAQIRGPVPPKRSASGKVVPHTFVREESPDSPEDDRLITPPSHFGAAETVGMVLLRNDEETPLRKTTKSFAGQKSFATLGHHLSTPLPVARIRLEKAKGETEGTPVHLRRQPSVPGSLLSFYEDETATESPRPLVALSHDNPSLAVQTLVEDGPIGRTPLYQSPPTPTTPIQAPSSVTIATPRHISSLPPFESFRSSPKCVPSESPVLPEIRALSKFSVGLGSDWGITGSSSPNAKAREMALECVINETSDVRMSAEAIRSDQDLGTPQRKDRGQSLPSSLVRMAPNKKGLTLDFVRSRYVPQKSSDTVPTPKTASTPHSKMSQGQASGTGSGQSPCSPMTAFILSAPADGLWSYGYDKETTPTKSCDPHPFAYRKDQIPPTPPTKSSYLQKQHRLLPPGKVLRQTRMQEPVSPSPSPHGPRRQLDSVAVNVKGYTNGNGLGRSRSKIEIVGTGMGAGAGGKLDRRKGKGWEGLTPGMEDGNRPPKSGLPRDDLERWLKGTNT